MLIDNIVSMGLQIMKRKKVGSAKIFERRWRSHFGATPQVCSDVWVMLSDVLLESTKLEHLLWACLFLKMYPTESTACTLSGGVDEKTWRNILWPVIEAIASLEYKVVSRF